MGFEKAVIYRPGVLLVDREESRFTERIAQKIFTWVDTGRSEFLVSLYSGGEGGIPK